MFRAHVIIIRRLKLHYTATGIIKPIGGRLVQGLREQNAKKHIVLVTYKTKTNFR